MSHQSTRAAGTKWPTLVGIVVLLGATVVNWYWVWGLLFLYWTVVSVGSGQVFVVQTVRRDENPYLFWAVNVLWLILAILVIVTDLSSGVASWLEGTDG